MVEKVIKYDDKILKDFVKFHFRKINIIMLVCGALMLVAGIFYFLVSKYVMGALTCVAGVLFACFPLIITGMSLGQNRQMLDTTESFVFGETEMKVETERFGEVLYTATTKYSNLDSIKENADYLFVYINKNSAITLRKTDLSKEEYSFIVTNISKALNKRTNSVANKK